MPARPGISPKDSKSLQTEIPLDGESGMVKNQGAPTKGISMVAAYVLVQTDVGRSTDVAASISQLPGVTMAAPVAGPYDVIAKIEAETVDMIGKLVVSQIQAVEGITRTLTCPIVVL